MSQVAYTEGVYLSPVDTSKTEGITLSRKSENNSSFKHQANDTDHKIDVANNIVKLALKNFNVSHIISSKGYSIEGDKKFTANTYQIFTISNPVPAQGEAVYVGPIGLQPGQICQAQLDEPIKESSNYYLVLLEANSSGEATIVDASTYSNNDTPDSVGIVNKSGSAKTYYVGVLADKVADPADEFTVHLSLSTTFDSNEANENAATASKFPYDIDEEMGTYSIGGATLNSPYDNDWYEVYIPTARELVSLIIEPTDQSDNTISDIGIEVYRTPDGSELVKQTNSGNSFAIGTGHYYIRVFSTNYDSTFNEMTYNLKITPGRYAETANYVVLMNGQPLPIQKYELGGERYALLGGSEFEWKVTYYSPSGRPATDANDMIYTQIFDRHWRPDAGRAYEVHGIAVSEEDVADLIIEKVPPVYGGGSGVSGMKYDYDASLHMDSVLFGTVYDELIFITSRIMG